jgi:Protein of unknown function (DUF3151)
VSDNDSSSRPINLSGSGLPTTVLPAADSVANQLLHDALQSPEAVRRDAVAAVVARYPRYLAAWTALGDLGRDPIERYAAYRVGYHRGLDALRGSGWRGSGYVRWSAEPNVGFLRALVGLGEMATVIGEFDEAERIGILLAQLDPSGVPASAR